MVQNATSSQQGFFLTVTEYGQYKLKERHNYYNQVQGAMMATKTSWCLFVIRGYGRRIFGCCYLIVSAA